MTTPTPLRKQSANNFKRANNPLMLNRLQTPFKRPCFALQKTAFQAAKGHLLPPVLPYFGKQPLYLHL